MIIIFIDERIPDIEIRNYGRCTFEVYIGGRVTECFTSYENEGSNEVSPNYAAETAQRHFECMNDRFNRLRDQLDQNHIPYKEG